MTVQIGYTSSTVSSTGTDSHPAASHWRLDSFRRRLAAPDGTPIPLTRRELEFIDLLSAHDGKPVSRDTIAQTLMGREWLPGDRSMDVLVRRLRDKLNRYTGSRDLIRTVRNVGYSLAGTCVAR